MHPYKNLEEKFFWSSAIAKKNMFDIDGLWDPKFPITPRQKIVTFGSCFAQHIGRALELRGFNWLNTELAPAGLSAENAKKYNYGIFSCRTGNIYTASLLKQWVDWATKEASVPDEIWEKDERFFDPFRPNIEPNGFASKNELLHSRERTLESFNEALTTANLFVFTLGLTETWIHQQASYEYPMCPGTAAGTFDKNTHKFVNQKYPLIRKVLQETIKKIKELNPNIKFLLTVSPVPLTATMSGNHVLVATMESKAILRSVAGQLADQSSSVDYFPAYEIINATPFRGTFFESNQRSVNPVGIDHVMNCFFNCLNMKYPIERSPEKSHKSSDLHIRQLNAAHESAYDVVCEEEILSAFGK
ncbi:hypothetical protein DO97_04310 [Neosynechococcus sphagnicola sy1]|uniref:GSCFA domain-containing protein n=2 Tax=Neosynechococcus TaxID=1501143 RepID=A0A098TKV7_9CYAN|nr:hypothetical protein DO97_04310 [Neosynechococcus sphagnicola sy1]